MTWKLSFKQALAVRWEEEHLGLIETPATLPKRSDSRFVHPTLVIEDSAWARPLRRAKVLAR
jgi:hypothetical protein